jgi:alpha-glucosidase
MLDAEEINLPPGAWYDYWTAQKLSSGENIALHPALSELALYVRAGAILPMQPLIQNTGENPKGPLELRVYPGDDCHGALYADDGHTFGYQKGEILRVTYSCRVSPDSITVNGHTEKSAFQPWWNAAEMTVFGLTAEPKELRLGDRAIHDWHYDRRSHAVTLTVPDALKNWTVQVAF